MEQRDSSQNLSCHNKTMRSGPERLKSSSKCTQTRAVPSPCRQQNLLQKAPGHPILDPCFFPEIKGSPLAVSPQLLLALGWDAFAASPTQCCESVPSLGSVVGSAPASPSPRCRSSPDAAGLAGSPFWGHPRLRVCSLLCCILRGHCGDTEGPHSPGAPLSQPPQPGCAPAGSPRCRHWVALARLGTGAASRNFFFFFSGGKHRD